ncbi:hypothetical protein CRG98_003056 [Punica granatum]|uniref:Uncharacterized protein n=1 Tax=Punica granatum TaxID=22663 RepID=A0A2I0L726_PUNGR|nr:hypothetical protein CRG98_003056 [Punica granatum]
MSALLYILQFGNFTVLLKKVGNRFSGRTPTGQVAPHCWAAAWRNGSRLASTESETAVKVAYRSQRISFLFVLLCSTAFRSQPLTSANPVLASAFVN